MTKEEWDEVQRHLTFPGTTVHMKIDGYDISAQLQRHTSTSLKYDIMIYVNGYFKGEWMVNDCEIRNRFYCKRTHDTMSRKDKERLKKASKAVKKLVEEHGHKYDIYYPYWTSFRSMKSHFIKNNSSIELVEKESY